MSGRVCAGCRTHGVEVDAPRDPFDVDTVGDAVHVHPVRHPVHVHPGHQVVQVELGDDGGYEPPQRGARLRAHGGRGTESQPRPERQNGFQRAFGAAMRSHERIAAPRGGARFIRYG